MKKLIVMLIAGVTLASCGNVNNDDAIRLLSSQNLVDIHLTGYSAVFSGCGKDDSYNTGFTAKTTSGQPVKGVICGGIFKGYTVRYY